MKNVILLLTLFAAGPVIAVKGKKPVSVSYEAVVRCYPELEDKEQSFRVNLDKLKDRIDAVFATERTELKSRVVKFRDGDGALRRMRISEKSIQWETISDDGVSQPWTSESLPKDPNSSAVGTVLARGRIESDERIERDVKLKGLSVQTRRDQAKVIELRLESAEGKKALTCQDRSEFGSICLCKL